jgi:hypothetical protein
VQISIHARLKDRDAAQLVELAGLRFVVEGAGNEHIKAGITCFARSIDQIRAGNGTELGADENNRSFLRNSPATPSMYLPSAQI